VDTSQLDLCRFAVEVRPEGLSSYGGHSLTYYEFTHGAWSSDRYPDFGDNIFIDRPDYYPFTVDTPPWPISWCGNLNPYAIKADAASRQYLTDRPSTSRYSPDADYQRYAGLTQALGSVIQGTLVNYPPKSAEKDTNHVAVKGIVSDSAWSDIRLVPGPDVYGWGPYWTSRKEAGNSVFRNAYYPAGSEEKLSWAEYGRGSLDTSPLAGGIDLLGWLAAKLAYLKENPNPVQWDLPLGAIIGREWLFHSGSLEISPVPTGDFGRSVVFAEFRASYDFWMKHYDNDANVIFESPVFHKRLHWRIGMRPSWGLRSAQSWIWPRPDMLTFWNNSQITTSPGSAGVLGVSVQGNGFSVAPNTTPRSLFSPMNVIANDQPEFKDFFFSSGGTYLKKSEWLRRKSETLMREIRPSSFIAFSNAMDENLLALKANHLQNLQHLKDVLGLLPDLGKAGQVIAKLAAGDFSALPQALDLLTELILQYRFQQAPIARDVAEFARIEIRSELESLTQPKTVTWRGKFLYDFLPEENFMGSGSLHLSAHTKANLTMDLSTALSGIVAANSVGLLPNLSRLWSLVPFSFIVDWFTNEAERLHLVDNQILSLFALRVHYCVHSYKITWYPDASELGSHGLMTDPLDPFRISYYQRELSLYMPSLHNSKFDFMRRKTGPDPIVVGSLAYQLSS